MQEHLCKPCSLCTGFAGKHALVPCVWDSTISLKMLARCKPYDSPIRLYASRSSSSKGSGTSAAAIEGCRILRMLCSRQPTSLPSLMPKRLVQRPAMEPAATVPASCRRWTFPSRRQPSSGRCRKLTLARGWWEARAAIWRCFAPGWLSPLPDSTVFLTGFNGRGARSQELQGHACDRGP